MDRGAWWAAINGVTKSQTQLSKWHFTESTGVLRDLFFNERKKTTQPHKLHFQQSGARVYFLVFPFPEEHSFLTLQTS